MGIKQIEFVKNHYKIKQSNLDELMDKIQHRKIKKKKLFCRILHDLNYLIEINEVDYPKYSWTCPISELQILYKKIYWRHYYFFLYCFIYYNYTQQKYIEVEQAFRKKFEEEEIDEELGFLEEDTDYSLFRKIYPSLALYKALLDAYVYYEKILEDKTLFKEIEDLELLEKRLDIRKHDVSRNGNIVMMYLTYGRNPTKSYSSRVRNFNTKVLKQQEEAKDFSNYLAALILNDYYRKKYYNSKLRIDEFLETQDIKKISKRTFFSYKKYYDKKFGVGHFKKNTEEKAYIKYLVELEKNPALEIDAKLCRKLGVGQKKLKEQIKKENNRI